MTTEDTPRADNALSLTENILCISGPIDNSLSLAREIAAKRGPFAEISAQEALNDFRISDCLAQRPITLIIKGATTREGLRKLKDIATNKTVVCNRKYQEPFRVPAPNLIICTGNVDALPMSQSDRRFWIKESA